MRAPPDAAQLVLVIDDEPGIVDFVEMGLRDEGYRVASAATASEGLEVLRHERPDAVILDVGLPDADGFDIVAAIRAESDVPIVMLTARGEVEDRVRGLQLGADDYIAKPFHFVELLARVQAHLRRSTRSDEVVRVGDVALDPRTHVVTRRDSPIQLTPREYELLELFLRHPGEVLSKEVILDRLWGYSFDGNLVEVYVGYLRRKLGEPQMVETLRGVGYVLREVSG
ncbi:MAG TPA: response regulator transcription factor [Candidatus Limnocylindria bacterium]|nr:response regulator transcription factor [Candidatus Limnocylindria bacterium]